MIRRGWRSPLSRALLLAVLVIACVAACAAAAHVAPVQPHRPPPAMPAHTELVRRIASESELLSADARQWVLEYLASAALRAELHSSLQHLSAEELLEMLTWEVAHLPLIHNAPVSWSESRRIGIADDSALNVTLESGWMHNVCQRYVLGEGMPRQRMEYLVSDPFEAYYGLPRFSRRWTLSDANTCLLFNALDLVKSTRGHPAYFGGVLYALNRRRVSDRMFLVAMDSGTMLAYATAHNVTRPALGTPQHWFHLVQPHLELFNLPYIPNHYASPTGPCCTYTLAALFNRWWVPNTGIPGEGLLFFVPYFEAMLAGSAWLPEDLLFIVGGYEREHADNALWGTALGEQLQQLMIANNRPLLWAASDDGPLLLDPIVGGVVGERVTAQMIYSFQLYWRMEPTERSFDALARELGPRMRVRHASWHTREACAEVEADAANGVIGVDDVGECVFWREEASGERWECVSDGTCRRGTAGDASRAVFETEEDCLEACANTKWACVSSSSRFGVRFCTQSAGGRHDSLASCERACKCT